MFEKIYALQDNDCTPVHFAYSEMDDNCGANNFNGGKVSAEAAKRNTLRMMWQLEAMRHKLGPGYPGHPVRTWSAPNC